MVSTYTTLLGKIVVVKELTPEQKELLRTALNKFKNKEEWGAFCNNVAYNNDTVRILGGELYKGTYWITGKVLDEFLYQVLNDMEVRLGVEQGKMRQDDLSHWDFAENEKALMEVLK